MPSLFKKRKEKVFGKPSGTTLRISSEPLPPRRDRTGSNDWDDIFDNPSRRQTDPLTYFFDFSDIPRSPSNTTRREFALPDGYQVAIRQRSREVRSSGDQIPLIGGRASRNNRIIHDLQRSRPFFRGTRSSRDVSRGHERERGRATDPRRSTEQHLRRRRKSSHPKELSRKRDGGRDTSLSIRNDARSIDSVPSVPQSVVGGGMIGTYNENEHERFEADKARLRDRKMLDERDRKAQDRSINDNRKDKKWLMERDDKEQRQFQRDDKHKSNKIAAEQAKAAAVLAMRQMDEETDRRRRQRGDHLDVTALTEANLGAAKSNDSDSGGSVRSELNRGIGNMNRTILEGMLPAEEILRAEKGDARRL